MSEIVATTAGLFPLPDEAKTRLSSLKGHQKGDLIAGDEGSDVQAAYESARRTVVAEQAAAGLDRVTEGQLRWDDMLAHPAIVSESVDPGGIVRYYDNNNFYRDPQIRDALEPTGDVAEELRAATDLWDATVERPEGFQRAGESVELSGEPGERLQAVLPGPYTLAELVSDEYYDDEAELLAACGEFLAAEAEQFPEYATLFVNEPSFVTSPPGDGTDERAAAAIDTLAGATDAEVVVHTAWGTFEEKPYAHLLDADIDAVGFDFVNADREQTLYCINEYGTTDSVAVGLVDGQNTRVESPETIADRVAWVNDQTVGSFERTFVTPTTSLFFLPVGPHREKLAALAEGARLAERRDGDADGESADGDVGETTDDDAADEQEVQA